ncbi:MAG TPA: glycine oxidase ThiO [Gammaproteobacteria bacterium]|nr:glycine oxidase ThiO [Gammaproteobacteria bacterium]
MSTTTDIVIVGAGIIGLLTARELARAGQQVTIIDRGQPGREASRTAAGILSHLPPWESPDALLPLTNWSRTVYPALAEDIQRQSHLSAGFDACGAFYVLTENGDELAQAERWTRSQGEPFEYFSAGSLQRYEPALHAPNGAVCLPAVGRLSTTHFLRALQEAVLQAGVQIVSRTVVERLAQENNRVIGVQTGHGTIHARQTVLATGAWTDALLAPLGIATLIEPVRGQIIQYAAPPGLLGRVALDTQGYAVPTQRGTILVGSTKERVGFDKSTSPKGRTTLHTQAARLLPVLADMPVIGHWANLRPASPDGLPLIGSVGDWPGLWLNTGHYSDGINTAPASARLLADLLLERTTAMNVSAYAPDRLADFARHSGESRNPVA